MFESRTFTLGEKEKSKFYGDYNGICYCSYCGEQAMKKDVGSSHNHRWEEDIIYFCNCQHALDEIELRKEIANHKNKIFYLERSLMDLEKHTDNEIVNTMKFNKEFADLKEKYKISGGSLE